MAFVLQQNKGASVTGTNPTASFTSTPTVGNLLVAVLATNDGTTGNITNPSGWTTRAEIFSTVTPIGGVRIVEKIAGASEPTAVTFTDATSVAYSLEIMEFSGNAASGSEFDAASAGASNAANVSSIQPGSLTPAASGELFVVGSCQVGSNGVPGATAIDSSFVVLDNTTLSRGVIGYKIKTDAAAENPTCSWATTRGCLAIQCAFKAGATSTGAPDRHLPRGVERGMSRGVAA